MGKNEFCRGHCINDKGELCPHIKGARDDTPGDEVTMGCEYGEKYCPYVKDEKKMGIGRAVAICTMIDSEKYSVDDKILAIHEVMNMPTHMGVVKDTLIGVIRWLWNFNLEVGESHNGKRIVEIETPHGDLIDREDLIFEINRHCYTDYNDYNFVYDAICDADAVVEAEDDNEPTD